MVKIFSKSGVVGFWGNRINNKVKAIGKICPPSPLYPFSRRAKVSPSQKRILRGVLQFLRHLPQRKRVCTHVWQQSILEQLKLFHLHTKNNWMSTYMQSLLELLLLRKKNYLIRDPYGTSSASTSNRPSFWVSKSEDIVRAVRKPGAVLLLPIRSVQAKCLHAILSKMNKPSETAGLMWLATTQCLVTYGIT